MHFNRSKKLIRRAEKLLVGGVNSPVRAFKGVGGTPLFFKSASGAYLTDVDNNRYVDYCLSWGAIILGHCHQKVESALKKALRHGVSFGACHPRESELARSIQIAMPVVQKLRLTNSGTEATLTAIRLARGFTGKSKIIKFEGCYHGHVDSLLVKAGSGLLTLGRPTSKGILNSEAKSTIVLPYNDTCALEKIFNRPHDIAAVIIEPVAGNMGVIPAHLDFLKRLRKLTEDTKTLLIFDEVMSGFRVAKGGAQSLYDISPDLVTLGKVIGGGLPIGAVGGRREIMDYLAPLGPVYQAGTLSGNPLAVAAGIAALEGISEKNFFEVMNNRLDILLLNIEHLFGQRGIPVQIQREGALFSFFFSEKPVNNFQDVTHCQVSLYKKLFHLLIKNGIYVPPSPYEAWFFSSAHLNKEIEQTLDAMKKSIRHL